MNITAPEISESTSAPTAAGPRRVPLGQLAKHSEVLSVSLRERVLPSTEKGRVEVLSFQSSI
ncbi:hypothetical protein [Streptacidiphilus sp. EB129]|uniref:hypothetical protein n=1 Tax=Streptacidiphilus sp. EB129 TaxID=3156262 RepID=UPI003517358E